VSHAHTHIRTHAHAHAHIHTHHTLAATLMPDFLQGHSLFTDALTKTIAMYYKKEYTQLLTHFTNIRHLVCYARTIFCRAFAGALLPLLDLCNGMCCADEKRTSGLVAMDSKTFVGKKTRKENFDTLRIQKPVKIGEIITVHYGDIGGLLDAMVTHGCVEVCPTKPGLTDIVQNAPLDVNDFWSHLTPLQKRFLVLHADVNRIIVESFLCLPCKIPHISDIPWMIASRGVLPRLLRQVLIVACIDDKPTLQNMIRIGRLKFPEGIMVAETVVALLVRLCVIQLQKYSNPSIEEDIKVWNDKSKPKYVRIAARVSAASAFAVAVCYMESLAEHQTQYLTTWICQSVYCVWKRISPSPLWQVPLGAVLFQSMPKVKLEES